ncbi:5-methylcytosine restriction system specificity protein McrC [Brachybacterium sp.]|uniref:5-methylcytosine restriction system specificity protein McrC n=1 Tax=Brachybacterium sp. TaxID=1891286 RepID=UPI002ED5B1DF
MFVAGEGSTRIDVRSVWFLLLYASEFLERLTGEDRERLLRGERDNDLLDALADVLAARVERRVRTMLALGYRRRIEPLTRVRGRIDHLGTARGQLMQSGRVLCRYDEQTVDLPRYRSMLVTLRRAAPRAISDDVRRRCLTTAQMLERCGVSPVDPTPAQLSTEQFGHFDGEDRTLLALSSLVRDMCAPEHAPGTNELPEILRQKEGAMRALFEKAVRGFYRHHLVSQGYAVKSASQPWPATGDPADLAFLPNLNADVVISGHGEQVIIECKFAPIFTHHRDKAMIKPDHVRQLVSYASVFRATFAGKTRAVLLGALVGGSPGRDLDVTIDGIPFAVRQVDLAARPAEIRSALSRAWDRANRAVNNVRPLDRTDPALIEPVEL